MRTPVGKGNVIIRMNSHSIEGPFLPSNSPDFFYMLIILSMRKCEIREFRVIIFEWHCLSPRGIRLLRRRRVIELP